MDKYNLHEIRKKILIIMLPMALEGLLQVLTGIVSSAMVGRLTVEAISAQGISDKVTNITYQLYRGIGIGLTVITAQKYAQSKNEECKATYEQTVASLLGITVGIVVVFYFFATAFLRIFTPDMELIAYAEPYFKIAIFGLPAWCIIAASASFYQGIGDTITPMKVAAAVNVFNIVIGYMLIFGKLGAPCLDYYGAAVSIAVSRTLGAVIYLYILYGKHGKFAEMGCAGGFARKKAGPALKGVYTVGMPAAAEHINWYIGSIILSVIVMNYGTEYFSAYQLGLQAEGLIEVPPTGFSVAATSLVSAAIALNDRNLYRIYEQEIKKICFGVTIVTSCILIFKSDLMMALLTDKPQLIKIGMTYVIAMGFIQIPQNMSKINCGILRSIGYKKTPMISHLFGTWVIRLPGAFFCGIIAKSPIEFIWLFVAADQLVRYMISFVILKSKKVYENFDRYSIDN